MFRSLVITVLLFFFCSFKLTANSFDYQYQKAFRVQSLSLEQGLSQSVVNDIIQDSEGFIWIATEDGLNQFDGYQFKVFQQDHEDPASLHENLVYSLVEEPGKGLWVGTQNGVTFYNSKTGKFDVLNQKNNELKTAIVTLALLPSKNLAIGSENGFYLFDKQKDSVQIFRSQDGQEIDDEISAFEVFEDQLWVATESCIYAVKENARAINSLCNGALGEWLKGRRVKVLRYHQGELWVGTNDGLGRYDLQTNQLQIYRADKNNDKSLTSNWIQAIAFDQKDNMWIGTSQGLSVYRFSENEFDQYVHRAENRDGLTANDILSVYIDANGLVWLGTYAAGINILDPSQTGFNQILSKSDVLPFDANNTVHGIVKDKNENLWMATYGTGLIKLNLMTGKVTRPFQSQVIKKNDVFEYNYSLLIDLNNRLWVGTFAGLYLVDLDSQKLLDTKIIVNNKQTDFNQYIFQVYEDHSGKIWIATINGLYVVNKMEKVDDSITLYLIGKHPEIPNSFRDRSSRISCILESRDGNLWVGGISGLLLYVKSQNKWKHFEYQAENKQSLSNDDVQVLFEDSRGILWVGTANGLNKVHRESNEAVYFERITRHQGLPSNSIYGILEDNYRQLWLSTNLGLVRYSGQAESMQRFRRSDGITSDEFNTAAYFADSDGVLYFGSINGVTAIDSRVIPDTVKEHKPIFTELKIGERTLDVYPFNHGEKQTIYKQKDEASLRVSVSNLYFKKLNTQSYRYRLLGLDDEWVNLGKERTFILAGLNDGHYVLDIQSKVTNDSWSDSLRVELFVSSNFWKSDSVFYFVIGFVFFIFVVLIVMIKRYYEMGMIRAENLVKVESVRLKDVRKQNDELSGELDNRNKELSFISDKLNEATQLIDSFQFRDTVSGFYRYQNIKNMLNISATQSLGISEKFNLLVVFQLTDIQVLAEQYGSIVLSEIVNYVALEIKKQLPANVSICSLSDDSFLILANSKIHTNLSNTIVQLRNKILRCKIPIANDNTIQTRVAMSYIEIYPEVIDDYQIVLSLCDTLISVHRQINEPSVSSLMRLDINLALADFVNLVNDRNINSLLEENSLTVHFIE